MRRLRAEEGLTLIELLMASTVMLIVLGATLTVFDALQDDHVRVQQHNEAQDEARRGTDRLARDLRNLASPTVLNDVTAAQPNAVDVAEPYDFVFKAVAETKPAGSANAANVRRVRYCLDARDPGRGRVWMQFQTWLTASAPPVPSRTACPGTGWTGESVVASSLVNRIGGADRPVFSYNTTAVREITRVRTRLIVDPTPGAGPVESRLSTGVLLRNQNQFPVASMVVTRTGTAGSVLLNGFASSDPEGQPLRYWWYADPPTPLPDCRATPRPASCLGEGGTLTATLTPGQPHTVHLLVEDPAGLRDTADPVTDTY